MASIASSVTLDLINGQTVACELPGQQVLFRDDALVRVGVAGQLDYRHGLPQHRRHRSEAVGRGHEECLAQIERHVDVAVAKRRTRRRGDSLAQRRRRAVTLVELVDLVEDEHRIADADAPQFLDDPAGRSRGVAVHRRRAVQLAAGHPGAGAPEGRGKEPGQRRLAHPRRTHEADHRRRRLRLRQAHGEVVDEPLLHRAVPGVPPRRGPPWRARDPSGAAVRFVHGRLARRRRYLRCFACSGSVRGHAASRSRNLPPPLAHSVRHARRVELFAEPVETVGAVDGRRAEKRAHLRRRDAVADERRVAGLEAQRHLAADRLQTAW